MMCPMERDWARLGAALRAARKERGIGSQVDVADALGIGRSTVQAIERGDEWAKITQAVRAYARLVGWSDDSVETVLAGGEPTYSKGGVDPGEPLPEGTRLPLRVVQELTDDSQLIDSTVIPLTDDGDTRMVIIVKGKPDASPEQIKKALLEWEKREMHLRGLTGNQDRAEEA